MMIPVTERKVNTKDWRSGPDVNRGGINNGGRRNNDGGRNINRLLNVNRLLHHDWLLYHDRLWGCIDGLLDNSHWLGLHNGGRLRRLLVHDLLHGHTLVNDCRGLPHNDRWRGHINGRRFKCFGQDDAGANAG
jgi:hypothetical protein